jgi:uncharacterized protein (TIGR03437 family)
LIRNWSLALLLCAIATAASAQPPAIGQNGVFNSASHIPPTLPGGPIARGTLFTINGVRLGTQGVTTVAIVHDATRVSASVITVQPRQIEAQMPLNAPLGASSLVVETAGLASKPFPIDIVASRPGLFSRNGQGWGPGRVDNLDSQGRATPNAFDHPAVPGQRIRLSSTGLGGVTVIRAVIGTQPVKDARVRTGKRHGEEEITLRIPTGVPLGCYVPLYLEPVPTQASNVITVAIGSHPGRCDSGPVPLFDEERGAAVILSRTRMRESDSYDTVDYALARFAHKDNRPALSPLLLLPPAGTCTAYTSSFQEDSILPTSISVALVSDFGGLGLDAGPHLVLTGDGQSRNIPRIRAEPGWYKGSLNSRGPIPALGPFLEPGDFLLSAGGGKDLGPFQFKVKGPEPLEWTDAGEHAAIDRKLPLTVHWRAESSKRVVVILATNVGQITTAIGTCVCTAHASTGYFTVPSALLANIPVSVDIPGIPYDQLFVAVLPPQAAPLAISGLNGGAAISLYAEGRIVTYR